MADQPNPEVEIEEMEFEPGQKVAGTAELVDMIFGYLNPETLNNAGQVNRKWRSISAMHFKRRLKVSLFKYDPTRTIVYIRFNSQVQKPNKNNHQIPQQGDIELKINDIELKDRKIRFTQCSPILLVCMLELNCIAKVTKLELDCLTIDDWKAMGKAVIGKFASLVSLRIWFPRDRNSVLPLCYEELAYQSETDGAGDSAQHETLRDVRFQFIRPLRHSEYPPAGFFNSIVQDIIRLCLNLDTFELDSMFGEDALLWVKRSASRENFREQVMPTWEAGMKFDPGEVDLSEHWTQLLELLLSQVQVRKLWVPFYASLLSCLNVSSISALEKICLFPYALDEPLAIKTLISKPLFQNLTSLYWAYERHFVVKTWQDMAIDQGVAAAFPNVKILELRHKRGFPFEKRAEPEEFRMEDWICSKLSKMAPQVRKLIVHTHHGISRELVNIKYCWKDFHDVLKIVKSFEHLTELFIINNFNNQSIRGENIWDELDEIQVADSLKGLTEVTVAARNPQLLLGYARTLLEAAAGNAESTVEKFGFFTRDETIDGLGGDEIIDVNQLGVELPTVQVTLGLWNLDREGEASVEVDAYHCPLKEDFDYEPFWSRAAKKWLFD